MPAVIINQVKFIPFITCVLVPCVIATRVRFFVVSCVWMEWMDVWDVWADALVRRHARDLKEDVAALGDGSAALRARGHSPRAASAIQVPARIAYTDCPRTQFGSDL